MESMEERQLVNTHLYERRTTNAEMPLPYTTHVKGEETERMLKEGVIEPSNSEWTLTMVIVKKKDDTLRLSES